MIFILQESDKLNENLTNYNRKLNNDLDVVLKEKQVLSDKYEYNLSEVNYLKGLIKLNLLNLEKKKTK